MRKQELLDRLGIADPYVGFSELPLKSVQGWNGGAEVMIPLIEANRPGLIIEVGSWLGLSTIIMADALRKAGLTDSVILAVDTWLGSLEHWEEPYPKKSLGLENGFPNLYSRFLSNVMREGFSDTIVPLPLPSQIAGRYISKLGLRADLVYLDGSHDERDVYDDLVLYFELLRPGGAIAGDDVQWPSIDAALRRFCKEKKLELELTPVSFGDPIYWMVRKSF